MSDVTILGPGLGTNPIIESIWSAGTLDDLFIVAGRALETVAAWTEPTGFPTPRSSTFNAYLISSTYRLRRREFRELRA